MSYVVFARKYRPQIFEQVVGQDSISQTLRNALSNNRIASGYLFCGPRGTGKTTIARILAKAVNCVNGPTATPCGVCPTCQEITGGSSMDVLEIDAASNTGVDDIRTLRENVRYLPTSGKKRIYIIDEVHRLSGSAFDALLKTLEEPPAHVMFVFATTEPMKVPETILSRTQRFDFRRVSIETLGKHLAFIAAQEGLTITDPALQLVARKADGSVRDSLSLLDQVAAFAGVTITEKEVASALGLVDRAFLSMYMKAVASRDRKGLFAMVRQLFEQGIDIDDFVDELLDHLRMVMLYASDPESDDLKTLTAGELQDVQAQAGQFSIGDVVRLIRILGDLKSDLKTGLDDRLLLEVTSIRMAELESTVRLEDLLARLDSGQFAMTESGKNQELFRPASTPRVAPSQAPLSTPRPAVQTAPSAAPAAPSVAPASDEPSGTASLLQVKGGWANFMSAFRQSNPMLSAQLGVAELADLQAGKLTFRVAPTDERAMQLLQRPDNVRTLTRAVSDYFKAQLAPHFVIDATKASSSHDEPTSRPDPQQLLAKSERLRNLVAKVDGEIIGIKKMS